MATSVTDDRRFTRLAGLALFAGFLLVIVAFAMSLLTYSGVSRTSERVEHTHQVTDNLGRLILAIERNETATRGYLLTPAPLRIQTRADAVALVQPTSAQLRAQLADNPEQIRRFNQLMPLIVDQVNTTETLMNMARRGDLAAARALFTERVKIRQIEEIRIRIAQMERAEAELLRLRVEREQKQRRLLQFVFASTGILLLVLGAATYLLVRRYTNDLTSARDRLHLLNTDLESAVAERTADLKRANEEIQRFAYIVSHDLRSPLVNVMGFTAEMERADKIVTDFVGRVEAHQPELVSDEVRLAAHEDLPEAIGFIRSSTQKMDRLINAILSLSRQGRRVLTPELLQMDRIVSEIADSLAVQAEERGATITVEKPLPEIFHDRLAIEQIISNLMENATKYLAIGRPGEIVVRGSVSGSRARFEIEDNGRGVAPDDHERIFELFRRSGQQDQKGEGIGLANVRALAYRLGGTVTVRSDLGSGSTFLVDLPVEFSGEGKE